MLFKRVCCWGPLRLQYVAVLSYTKHAPLGSKLCRHCKEATQVMGERLYLQREFQLGCPQTSFALESGMLARMSCTPCIKPWITSHHLSAGLQVLCCRRPMWELIKRHLLTATGVEPDDVHRRFTFGAREIIAWLLVIVVSSLGAAAGMGGGSLAQPTASLQTLFCSPVQTLCYAHRRPGATCAADFAEVSLLAALQSLQKGQCSFCRALLADGRF